MAKIYNSSLTKELREGARIQVATDGIPSELADKVVPVMEVNPRLLKICNVIKSATALNATAANIIAVGAYTDLDVYITGFTLSVIKDTTSTSVISTITLQPDNQSAVAIFAIAGLSLTAQDSTLSLSLPYPIKIKRNTAVTLTNSTNVGNITSCATIIGYTIENVNI